MIEGEKGRKYDSFFDRGGGARGGRKESSSMPSIAKKNKGERYLIEDTKEGGGRRGSVPTRISRRRR